VEALSEALSGWGEDTGAIVVISHDKAFCEKVGFTHVATVQNGSLKMEQRDTRESDWDSSSSSTQPTMSSANGSMTTEDTNNNITPDTTEEDRKRKKQAYNAPKRIVKIEETVMKKEEKIAQLDDDMMVNGSDLNKLVELTKQKEALEAEVLELMEEWEELEGLLAQVAA
jgi:ATPase subunit of ABC transporter with duplicated ATPase domains